MVVVIGIGQLGGVFARGFLRLGHPVVPVVRGTDMAQTAAQWTEPALVLVAVAERDLSAVLEAMPPAWRPRVALIQNELLPPDWEAHGLTVPTVMSVWFEKRATFEARGLRPSPVFGPGADLMVAALAEMGMPARSLPDAAALTRELVVKNVYILAKNAAGLEVGGTGRDLWANHAELARTLSDEALDLQSAVLGATFDRVEVCAAVREGFDGGPDQKNLGRTAAARMARAVALADTHGVQVPTLRRLASSVKVD